MINEVQINHYFDYYNREYTLLVLISIGILGMFIFSLFSSMFLILISVVMIIISISFLSFLYKKYLKKYDMFKASIMEILSDENISIIEKKEKLDSYLSTVFDDKIERKTSIYSSVWFNQLKIDSYNFDEEFILYTEYKGFLNE
jgi:hypothetical protein